MENLAKMVWFVSNRRINKRDLRVSLMIIITSLLLNLFLFFNLAFFVDLYRCTHLPFVLFLCFLSDYRRAYLLISYIMCQTIGGCFIRIWIKVLWFTESVLVGFLHIDRLMSKCMSLFLLIFISLNYFIFHVST